jgi:Protein of unknown function (DUF2786)
MEFNKVLDRVRALVAKAEGSGVTAEESATYRAKADELMQKYLIEEWQLAGKAPVGLKPTRIKVDIGAGDSPLLTETATLVNVIANFCKCSSVWMMGSGSYGRQEYCYVYGYESDLRYFELLFTTLYLHMSGALFPKPDPSLSEGANVREMRHAGLNWNDVAEAYGWKLEERNGSNTTYRNEAGEVKKWGQVVGRIKRLYAQEIKARGEQPFSLGRGGAGNANFRLNAAQGYLHRISQRLRETAGKRAAGTELVLRDKSQNIADMIAEAHPDMQANAARSAKYNADAYARGVRHANTADLAPGGKVGSGSAGAIGA